MLIPKNILEVGRAASRDSSRYQLTSIYLQRNEDGSCQATSTDGRQITSAKFTEVHLWEEHPGGTEPKKGYSVILQASDAKRLLKQFPKCPGKPILENLCIDESNTNGKIPCVFFDMETRQDIELSAIQGTFPDYRHVSDSAGGGSKMLVNPFLLAEQLITVAKAAGLKKDSGTVSIEFNDEKPERNPLKITAVNHEVVVEGFVMPLVTENKK